MWRPFPICEADIDVSSVKAVRGRSMCDVRGERARPEKACLPFPGCEAVRSVTSRDPVRAGKSVPRVEAGQKP